MSYDRFIRYHERDMAANDGNYNVAINGDKYDLAQIGESYDRRPRGPEGNSAE
jgi:hypothetical protein